MKNWQQKGFLENDSDNSGAIRQLEKYLKEVPEYFRGLSPEAGGRRTSAGSHAGPYQQERYDRQRERSVGRIPVPGD